MHGIIATWRMALEGVQKADAMLKEGNQAADAIETAIREVEDYPYYKSVGYGGLPNQDGVLQMDAGYNDGAAMLLLAQSYEKKGDQDQANMKYQKIIEDYPDTDAARAAQEALDAQNSGGNADGTEE